jgi:hypothetical protein
MSDVSNPEGIATGLDAGPKVDERKTTTFIDYELVVTVQACPHRTFISSALRPALKRNQPLRMNHLVLFRWKLSSTPTDALRKVSL